MHLEWRLLGVCDPVLGQKGYAFERGGALYRVFNMISHSSGHKISKLYNHIQVLKVSAGETIRAGILDRGLCDRAEVESVGSDSGPVTVRMEQRAMLSGDARPKVSLICTLPRPRRFEQMLPVIANLGVQSIVVVGAADVPNDYFGSHLLRRPDLVREGLVTGLAQAATDCRVPSLVFRRSLSSFLSSELDTFFPQEVFHRAVAHPLSAMDNDVFGVEAPSVKLADLAPPLELSVDHIVVAVGGEGGWYQKELAMMRDRGFRPVHLGTRVLRSDVAVGSTFISISIPAVFIISPLMRSFLAGGIYSYDCE
jgi:16S rRNA U1498 N3-methylase RsmE